MSLGINLSWTYRVPPKWNTLDPEPGFWDQNPSWTCREPIVNLIMMHLSWICGESVVNLWWMYRGHVPDANSFFQLEELNVWKSWKLAWNKSLWLNMARYELILRLERALWLRIIFKPLLTPKGAMKIQKNYKKVLKSVPDQPSQAFVSQFESRFSSNQCMAKENGLRTITKYLMVAS